jgi:hypothetical protein
MDIFDNIFGSKSPEMKQAPTNQLHRLIIEELHTGEFMFKEPYWGLVSQYELRTIGGIPNVILSGFASKDGLRLLIGDLVDVLGTTSSGYGLWDEDDDATWTDDHTCDRLWLIDAQGRTIPAGGDSSSSVHLIADLAESPQLHVDITDWPVFLEIVRRHRAK